MHGDIIGSLRMSRCFVCEPHNAIVGDDRQENVLDMTAKQSTSTQNVSVDLVNDNPLHLQDVIGRISLGMIIKEHWIIGSLLI